MSTGSRDPAAADPNRTRKEVGANEALTLMLQALELLDENEGPDDAGAHLDLAIHRVKEWIAKGTVK
jgi:hypothetical protein